MFASDGYSNIAAAVLIAVVLGLIGIACGGAWSIIFYVLAGFTILFALFFFRDPDRSFPAEKDAIIAPADGKIVYLQEVKEPFYIKGKATQISIFLSLFNVHVNRSPATGKVEYLKYNPGKFLMAFDDRSSSINERADFGVRHPGGTKIFFRQITGFLARRIVYHLSEGDTVEAGKRFGMMKFGSRMDILLPPNVSIEVKKGDRTRGGETVIGRIKNP